MPRSAKPATQRLASVFRRPGWVARTDRKSMSADAMAALTGATIVLPQGVAFAAIAGLPPEYGFYTAMVTTAVAALAGSSWQAVTGPTTALSALVFAALAGTLAPGSPEFIVAAIGLACLVGLIQLAFALARLGALVDFVSHSVMLGFIAGAAILIALSQLGAIAGVPLGRPEALPAFLMDLPGKLAEADGASLTIAAATIATGLAMQRLRPRWPHYLIGLTAGTAVSELFRQQGADLAVVGRIEAVLPVFALPQIDVGLIRDYGSAAVAIAMVGVLEALSVGRALAARSGQPFDANREILGQGIGNLAGSFFRCFPGSASFTRSGVNFEAGAQTPLAAVLAALFLFLILQLVAPWFALVPKAAIGAIILLVAWRLVDMRALHHLASTSRSEAVIAAVTFAATLLFSLEVSIYIGVFLSFVFFARTASRPHVGVGAPNPAAPRRRFGETAAEGLAECPQLMVARLDGPLFFGSVEHLRRTFQRFESERPDQITMLLVLKGVGEIDLPGAELLIEEARRRALRGGALHLQTRTTAMIGKLARFGVLRALPATKIYESKGDAIAEIVPMLDAQICASCPHRIFRECPVPVRI